MMFWERLVSLAVIVTSVTTASAHQMTKEPFGMCSNKMGFVCDSTCKYLGVCTRPNDQVSFTWMQVKNCFNQYCNVKTAGCSQDPQVCEVYRPDITCTTAGTYPSPYDCTIYHECDPENGTVSHRCPAGTRYNSCTKKCDKELPDSGCSNVDSPCLESEKNIGVIPENRGIYYHCIEIESKKYIHVMGRCREGSFDEERKACVADLETGCPADNKDGIQHVTDGFGNETDAGGSGTGESEISTGGNETDVGGSGAGESEISTGGNKTDVGCSGAGESEISTGGNKTDAGGSGAGESEISTGGNETDVGGSGAGESEISTGGNETVAGGSGTGECEMGTGGNETGESEMGSGENQTSGADCGTSNNGNEGGTVDTDNKICKSEGLMKDSKNCAAYYFCTPKLHAIHINCSEGYYFVLSEGGCLKGNCKN